MRGPEQQQLPFRRFDYGRPERCGRNGWCAIGVRLLAIVTAATALGCAAGADPPATSRRALLPDVGPPPLVAAVSVNSARRATLRNAELVTNIVNGLPASARFLVITNDRPAFTVARNDRPGRVRFLDLPFRSPITIWTQDPFLVLAGPGDEITLLTSKAFDRGDDRLMADAIGRAAGYRVEPSGLFFEGGNIVSDGEHILIGANTIRHNASELDVADAEVVLRFEQELGRRVLVIGPVPQPIAHIDMAITPLGGRRIAVADAAAGAAIAERALKENPASVTAFERWCEEHFFGDPAIRELTGIRGPLTAPQVTGRTAEMVAKSKEVAPLLDGVAASLERHGYRVVRVPFLFGGPETDRGADDDSDRMRAAYPMLTYNNVIVDTDGSGSRVYLPRYGWPAMDDAAREAWRAQGFEVRTIDGLTISSMYGGALRCAVKVLARG